MIKLENNNLVVLINIFGAELKSLKNKKTNIEYIWPGLEGSFKKSAPNLFPFIGNIKNGEIDYPLMDDKRVTLKMTKHGFARDLEFKLNEVSSNRAVFELLPNDYTKEMYPYNFSFKVEYILEEDTLIHNYIVKNNGIEKMYYHVGGHTAFNCDYNDKNIENYFVAFEKEEVLLYKIDESNNMFLSNQSSKIDLEEKFKLKKEKFFKDALVFENLEQNKISLKHELSSHGIDFEYIDLPILTLWTSTDESNFICFEPWAGITDFTENSIKVEDKKDIQTLDSNEQKIYTQKIKVY